VVVGYPTDEQEQEILRRYHTGFDAHHLNRSNLTPVLSRAELPAIRAAIQAIVVEEGIFGYITQIANATRRSPDSDPGRQPARRHRYAAHRQDLRGAARPRLRDARRCQSRCCCPIYRHRIILRPEAEIEGLDADAVMQRIVAGVAAPR